MDNNQVNKKSSILKYILVAIDILVIAFIIFAYFKKNTKVESEDDNYKYQFKEFKYNVPDNINFSIDEYDNMVLATDAWTVTLDILGDSNNNILGNPTKIHNKYASSYENVSTRTELIDNVSVFVIEYTKDGKNKTLNYFKTQQEPYIYEVMVINADNSYDISPLEVAIPILLDGKYVKDDSVEYNYVK